MNTAVGVAFLLSSVFGAFSIITSASFLLSAQPWEREWSKRGRRWVCATAFFCIALVLSAIAAKGIAPLGTTIGSYVALAGGVAAIVWATRPII